MYCRKCGTQIEDTALFCSNCGERLSSTGTSVQNQPKKNMKKVSFLLRAIVGVVLLVILIVYLIGGVGYKRTLNNYFKAHENNDADLMYNSVVAQYWIDYVEEGFGDPYAMEYIQDSLEYRIDGWDCGDNIKITYKIKDKRRATKEQLEDLEENIYDWYAYYVYDRDEFSITDAYVLDIDFTVKGDEGTEDFSYPDGLLIIKENGRWRIPRGTISCSFYDNQ